MIARKWTLIMADLFPQCLTLVLTGTLFPARLPKRSRVHTCMCWQMSLATLVLTDDSSRS